MSEHDLTRDELLAQFIAMPERLEAALADLSESDLDLARSPDAWTIREIVHHIVDADDVTKIIVKAALGNPGCLYELEWYDPDNAWAETLDYAGRPIAPALALLRTNHSHIEELLQHLPDAWGRFVMLKRFEDSEEMRFTVGQLIYAQMGHVYHHIEHIRMTRQVHGR
jgi:hypothetical protein